MRRWTRCSTPPGRFAWALHQPASPERLWLHGKSKHHGRGAREANQRPECRNHPARLDAAFYDAADAHRRRICDARLHQRRTAGCRISHRAARRRHHLERSHPGRATRAFPRSAGPGDQGLVREGRFRLERQALSARHGEPLAAADSAAASHRSGFLAPASPRRRSMWLARTIASAI